MKLYWAPQSRALRGLWALEESGLSYDREVVDIRTGDQSKPAYRAINPMMKVPVLVDGDTVVTESGAICAYIAERAPNSDLAPTVGDAARGSYLRWLFFSAGCVEAAYTQKFTGLDLPSSTAGWGSFDRVIDVLEGQLTQGPWVLGARFSAADLMIGMDLYYGMAIFNIVPRRDAFVSYVERCVARPAFTRALAIEAAG
jgi:glutathione S-transferase